jgi:hypothetical protein
MAHPLVETHDSLSLRSAGRSNHSGGVSMDRIFIADSTLNLYLEGPGSQSGYIM